MNHQQNLALRGKRALETAWGGALAMLVLTLLLCGGALFSPGQVVLSSSATDVASLFAFWRAFAFEELRGGNLALWNPTILCGYPFFGNFQSAILYPLNWHYLFLPLDKAINLDCAIHLFLSGWLTFLWARFRGQSGVAAILAGAFVLLGAPVWLRVYAGHLGPLAVLAWTPLLFLAVDGWMQTQSVRAPSNSAWSTPEGANTLRAGLKWILVGAFAATMQIMAGYPQNVFYCAVAIGLYVAFCLVWSTPVWNALPWSTPERIDAQVVSENDARRALDWRARARIIGGIAAMYAGSAFLCAIQLGAGLAAASESVRGGGVAYHIAATMSFSPENLITLVAPGFFGDMKRFPHWGNGYLWEMSLSFGLIGLLLAVSGLSSATRRARLPVLLSMAALLVLAMGRFSPLYFYIYTYLPGFGSFRGSAKFIFFITLFLALFAGHGWDALRLEPRRARSAAISAGVFALLLAVFALAIRGSGNGGAWNDFMMYLLRTREIYYDAANYRNPEFMRDAAAFAAKSLWTAAAIAILAAAVLSAATRRPRVLALLAILAISEAFYFARDSRATFDFSTLVRPEKARFFASHPGSHRVLQVGFSNDAMLYRVRDLAGYDPCALRRYAEFIAWTQGENPNQADAYISFSRYHPLFAMLRARYFVQPTDEKGGRADAQFADKFRFGEFPPVMPRIALIDEYSVVQGGDAKARRDAAFRAMAQKGFDPKRKMILESEPNPRPQKGGAKGQVRIIDGSTDHLTIIASVPRPALLLVTDAYSKSWKAWGLDGSVQQNYSVLPANYVLRAIPLQAGEHVLRLEYSPTEYHIGKWISAFSLLIFAGLCFVVWRPGKSKNKVAVPEPADVSPRPE